MRRLLPFALVPLLACAPVRDDQEGECGGTGTLRVCVEWGPGSPLVDGAVEVLRSFEEVPLETPTDSAGCAELELDAGDWQWRARNAWGDCVSSWQPVDLPACEETERSLNIAEWCFDGDVPPPDPTPPAPG